MPDYRPVQLMQLRQLIGASKEKFDEGANAESLAKLKDYLQGQEQQRNVETARGLKNELDNNEKGHRYNVGLSSGGGVNIGEAQADDSAAMLRALQMQHLQEERANKHVQDLEDRSTKAGTAGAIPSLQRVEQQIPGLMEGKGKPKSVGGIKNLVPDLAVPVAEKFGVLPEGSSQERSALQELANTKIYDSSGKQINEAEMKRINNAMGMGGVFGSESLNDATKQLGQQVLEKQRTVTAGATPDAVQTFKSRGGKAGFNSLPELLGKKPAAPQGDTKTVGGVVYKKNPQTGMWDEQ